jgi:hypothetical protein
VELLQFTKFTVVARQLPMQITHMLVHHVLYLKHVLVDIQLVVHWDTLRQQRLHGIQTIPKQQLNVQEQVVLKLGHRQV